MKTKEQAFEQYHKEFTSYGPEDVPSPGCFHAGWDAREESLFATLPLKTLAAIREAVGDPDGKLTPEELVGRVRGLVEAERASAATMTFDALKDILEEDLSKIPEEILHAERRLSLWMAMNGYDDWELGQCRARFCQKGSNV